MDTLAFVVAYLMVYVVIIPLVLAIGLVGLFKLIDSFLK